MLDKVVRNADVADVDNLSFSSSLRIFSSVKLSLWLTFLAETSKVLYWVLRIVFHALAFILALRQVSFIQTSSVWLRLVRERLFVKLSTVVMRIKIKSLSMKETNGAKNLLLGWVRLDAYYNVLIRLLRLKRTPVLKSVTYMNKRGYRGREGIPLTHPIP